MQDLTSIAVMGKVEGRLDVTIRQEQISTNILMGVWVDGFQSDRLCEHTGIFRHLIGACGSVSAPIKSICNDGFTRIVRSL